VKSKARKHETPKTKTLVLNGIKSPRSLDDLIESLKSEVTETDIRETVWDLMDQGKVNLTWDRKLVAD